MPLRRWLFEVMLALAVAAFIIPFPRPSRAQTGCFPLEGLKTQIEAAPTFRILWGDKLARAVNLFNSKPPPENIPWTGAWFFIGPDGGGILFVGMGEGICSGMMIPADDVNEVLEIIDGVTA